MSVGAVRIKLKCAKVLVERISSQQQGSRAGLGDGISQKLAWGCRWLFSKIGLNIWADGIGAQMFNTIEALSHNTHLPDLHLF